MMDMLANFRMIVRCFMTKQRVVLVASILMAMSLNQASADTAKNSAAECFKLAEQYEKEANKYANDERDPREWFDLAMKNYMCAYKAGNHLAGFRAMQLSSSDNVVPLSKEMENRLLLEAAEADIADAQIGLAYDYCDYMGVTVQCKKPKEAEKWLLRAVRNGSPDAAFSLGYFYEKNLGNKGAVTAGKALACYKLSLQRYQNTINAKDIRDTQDLESSIGLTKWGIDRSLKTLGGKDPLDKCY
jgi:TPR repeat protein